MHAVRDAALKIILALKNAALITLSLCAAARPVAASAAPPTLADFWDGRAEFVTDVLQTGQPMGESDTLLRSDGTLWSYVHASYRSAFVTDSCGAPVEFPGCVVIYTSIDQGRSFRLPENPVCLIPCGECPCVSETDHTDQQQYPRIFVDGKQTWMVYEFHGGVYLRSSKDGLTWSMPIHVADSAVWMLLHRPCISPESIGPHPHITTHFDCLRGGPPGIFVDSGVIYVFIAQGQNPGAIGCFARRVDRPRAPFVACKYNPLFIGAPSYGDHDAKDASANPFFDFRMISSADVHMLGTKKERRFYMLYEGVRGPGRDDPGDTQFGLGLARSTTDAIDGPWEKFPGNPILVDMPGNIGLGHADLVVMNSITYLYTSLNGWTRGRLELRWKAG
ncbi:MAG: hypothetical protein NTZ50_13660 [Chloroflexi bacterium]|nr:hypothetical protein [Chloroflexota bacterium]